MLGRCIRGASQSGVDLRVAHERTSCAARHYDAQAQVTSALRVRGYLGIDRCVNKPRATKKRCKRGPIADVELLENVMKVNLDRAVSHVQPAPNFLVRQSLRYQMHDLALALRQLHKTFFRHHGFRLTDGFLRMRERLHSLAGRHEPQGLHQYLGLLILEDNAIGTGCSERSQVAIFYR